MIRDDPCSVLVGLPRKPPRHGDVTEPHTRTSNREHRGSGAPLLHLLQRHLRRPLAHIRIAKTSFGYFGHKTGRRKMVMDVDPKWPDSCLCQRQSRKEGSRTERAKPCQELPPCRCPGARHAAPVDHGIFWHSALLISLWRRRFNKHEFPI